MPNCTIKCKECKTVMSQKSSLQWHYIYNCPNCDRKVIETLALIIEK